MRFPMLVDLCCCAVCFKLAWSCPNGRLLRKQSSVAYLGSCSRITAHSEQWTIKVDLTLKPGEYWEDNTGWILPTPKDAFWLKSAHLVVVDRSETQRFMWPPMHVHHIVCRASQTDVWYERDVYDHASSFLALAGAGLMNEHLQQYDILNGSNGWGSYYPAGTSVSCGHRIDDDRLHGERRQYRLLINLHVRIDSDKSLDLQPFSSTLWEGTPTGQFGYNTLAGPVTVWSKEYRAPRAGSFHPDSFGVHTHPGAKLMELMAKRLGGQDLITPQRLLTLTLPSITVEPGEQSQRLNVKPGVYMRQPIKTWSKMGRQWLKGNLNKSGVGSNRSCAFQEGDIFYTKSIHDAPNSTINTMMVLLAVVLWSEPPLSTVTLSEYRYAGLLRNQLTEASHVPLDLISRVPRRLSKSSLYGLHLRMPLFFCHPNRVADREYVGCLRKINMRELNGLYSVKDLDEKRLAIKQRSC